MILFLTVMLTDVVLLDLLTPWDYPPPPPYRWCLNCWGSRGCLAVHGMDLGSGESLAEYINSGKALAIIGGIFISIAIAFVLGTIIMYISRLIFSFNYAKPFKYLGALWGGIALTTITYFAIFKGLKGSVLVTDEFLFYLEHNMGSALLYTLIGWTLLMALLQHLFRVNILRVIVLAGTAALAMAFAGNDLVNFIGVFMAGFDSFQIAQGVAAGGGDINELYMGKLSEPVVAHFGWLLGAGVIMVLALCFSKKSRTVTQTEVNLSRKGEGIERFSSSPLSRSIVRGSIAIGKPIGKLVPKTVKEFIDKRFAPVPLENNAPFDLIRASVNLTISALLISLGTSLNFPYPPRSSPS